MTGYFIYSLIVADFFLYDKHLKENLFQVNHSSPTLKEKLKYSERHGKHIYENHAKIATLSFMLL